MRTFDLRKTMGWLQSEQGYTYRTFKEGMAPRVQGRAPEKDLSDSNLHHGYVIE
jgi:hypothetical protein